MRIVLFLITVSITQAFALDGYAQTIRLSLDFKNETIINILEKIEDQSEFYFMYDQTVVDVNQRRSINCENKTVTKVLNEVFKDSGITYKIEDRQIALSSSKIIKSAQQNSVSGTVTDESGQPLPGVTVVVKGTMEGTVTNTDGNYIISNLQSDVTLVFSFVGMKTQEIPIGEKTRIDVMMKEETIGLGEVIAIGYGTIKRSDLTGSVVSVKQEDLVKIPVTNISQAIQGRAVGVNVRQNQTSPGGGITIRVRGMNSFKGNSEPLFVIDGIMGGDINTINPSDIESIEILKDASSTAIYGTNGANGVILVTTKVGKIGKSTLNLDGYYSIQSIARELELMNSEEWVKMENDRLELLGYDGRWDLNNQHYTDWQDEVYRIAPIVNFKLSSSGGSSKMRYFTSFDYIKQDGIVINTDFERFNFRLNLDSEINDRITIGSRIGISRYHRNKLEAEDNSKAQNAVISSAMLPPNVNPYDEDGNLLPALTEWRPAQNGYIIRPNPIASQLGIVDESMTLGVTGSFFAEFELLKNLKFRPSFNFTLNSSESGYFKPTTVFDWSYRNKASIGFRDSERWNADFLLSYNKTFNDKHDIKLLAGYIESVYKVYIINN